MRNQKQPPACKVVAFCCCVFLFCISGLVIADPVIQSVSGEISIDEVISLSGFGFGQGGQIVSWDNFESGTDSQSLGNPIIGSQWSFQTPHPDRTPYPYYSNQQAHSSNKSAKVVWKEPGLQGYSINAFGWANKGPFRELYVTYWRYHDPSDLETDDRNYKQFFFFGGADYGGFSEQQQWLLNIPASNSTWQYHVQNYPTENWRFSGVNYQGTTYEWNRWECWMKYNDPHTAANGEFECWLDAELIRKDTGVDMCDVPGGNTIEDFRLGHMFQGYGSTQYARSYFDDIYISTSRARVELGNNADFGACTLREIQIPLSWEDNHISLRMHFSSFSSGESAYLFVVDEFGNASTGYPVTIDTGVEPPNDDNPPQITVTSPVAEGGYYEAPELIIPASGNASDDTGVVMISWFSDRGHRGMGVGSTSWFINEIILEEGDNYIEIRAYDLAGNWGATKFTAHYETPGIPGQPEIEE